MSATPAARGTDTGYGSYVLGVLMLVYVFNFLDRQILSILNERIKADLGVGDAQMGFLYGTAFAVFYAVFGIPLGRLADAWDRRRLISIGLAFWSAMTVLSGLSRNFLQLAGARIGVGIGEASASPAAYSMLSDYFPSNRRATVLAVYSSGIYLGVGLSLVLGGVIVDGWDAAYPAGDAPFGLRSWQVAFFVAGLPGLLLALWVWSLREPVRGQADGIVTPPPPHPFRDFLHELGAVLPPLTLLHLHRIGAGRRILLGNLAGALVLVGLAFGLTALTGAAEQWIALAIGSYAAFSWAQGLARRDPPTARLLLRTPSLRWAALGFSFLAFAGYGIGYWMPAFFLRFHSVSTSEVGIKLGLALAIGGWFGAIAGGVLGDRWRQRHPLGRIYMAILTAVLPIPIGLLMLTTENTTLAYWLYFPVTFFSSMWIGLGASTTQDLVLPRMRATASAAYILVLTFVGLALGPYSIGQISDVTGDLRLSIIVVGFGADVAALLLLLLTARHLTRDEATLRDRAREAGEPGL